MQGSHLKEPGLPCSFAVAIFRPRVRFPSVRPYSRPIGALESGPIGRAARSGGISVSRRLGASGHISVLSDDIIVFLTGSVERSTLETIIFICK